MSDDPHPALTQAFKVIEATLSAIMATQQAHARKIEELEDRNE